MGDVTFLHDLEKLNSELALGFKDEKEDYNNKINDENIIVDHLGFMSAFDSFVWGTDIVVYEEENENVKMMVSDQVFDEQNEIIESNVENEIVGIIGSEIIESNQVFDKENENVIIMESEFIKAGQLFNEENRFVDEENENLQIIESNFEEEDENTQIFQSDQLFEVGNENVGIMESEIIESIQVFDQERKIWELLDLKLTNLIKSREKNQFFDEENKNVRIMESEVIESNQVSDQIMESEVIKPDQVFDEENENFGIMEANQDSDAEDELLHVIESNQVFDENVRIMESEFIESDQVFDDRNMNVGIIESSELFDEDVNLQIMGSHQVFVEGNENLQLTESNQVFDEENDNVQSSWDLFQLDDNQREIFADDIIELEIIGSNQALSHGNVQIGSDSFALHDDQREVKENENVQIMESEIIVSNQVFNGENDNLGITESNQVTERAMGEDLEWEDIEDEREALSVFFDAEIDVDLDISVSMEDEYEIGDSDLDISVSMEEGIYDHNPNIEWEVLLNVQNLDPGTVTNNEDDEYEMMVGVEVQNPPASRKAIENLTDVVLTNGDENGENVLCAICKEEMGSGEKAKMLPCMHCYHGVCIERWLGMKNTCPVCRYELPTDDTSYERRRVERGR